MFKKLCAHFGISANVTIEPRTVHSSNFHYRSKLLLKELKIRGHHVPGVSPDSIQRHIGSLAKEEGEEILASIDLRYKLTPQQIDFIRQELAQDMKQLNAEYGIDVAQWGFNI